MEGQQRRLLRGTVVAFSILALVPPGMARAQSAGDGSSARENFPITVTADEQAFIVEGAQGVPASGRKGPTRRPSRCSRDRLSEEWIAGNAEPGLRESDRASTLGAERPDPRAVAYWIRCGTETRLMWVIPKPPAARAAPAPPTGARTAALSFRDEIPMPDVRIRVDPGLRGFVRIPSWFYVQGWDGSAIAWSRVTPWGSTVELEARPLAYRWDFGDSTVIETQSLGRPYPAEAGAVKHLYQEKNLDGWPVTVHFVFQARWRENGGPWQEDVEPIERTATVRYVVHEIRTVVTQVW